MFSGSLLHTQRIRVWYATFVKGSGAVQKGSTCELPLSDSISIKSYLAMSSAVPISSVRIEIPLGYAAIGLISPFVLLTFVKDIIRTTAGNVRVPETLVILTSLLERISVNSVIIFALDLPNSSNIIRPLLF